MMLANRIVREVLVGMALRKKGITDGQRGVREPRRIDQRTGNAATQSLHQIHELVFVVGLVPQDFNSLTPGSVANGALDVLQRI